MVSTFLGGFVIAFAKGWLLTLVMLSSIPAVVISGAVMSLVISKLASHGQASYSAAATVAEQTIGSIRTVSMLGLKTPYFLTVLIITMMTTPHKQVASFTGEKQAVDKYNKSLTKAYKSAVKEGLASGLGMGAVFCIVFCSYGLSVWYGGKMIIEKGYSGGDVLTIIFAVMTGSL